MVVVAVQEITVKLVLEAREQLAQDGIQSWPKRSLQTRESSHHLPFLASFLVAVHPLEAVVGSHRTVVHPVAKVLETAATVRPPIMVVAMVEMAPLVEAVCTSLRKTVFQEVVQS
jgi:hypothetical protein